MVATKRPTYAPPKSGLQKEAEGTGEEVLGTAGEAPGFGVEVLEAITPFSQAGKVAAKITHTKTGGELLKSTGGKLGSEAGKEVGSTIPNVVTTATKLLLNGALAIIGLVLVIFGIMVAVKPSGRTLPVPV